MTEVKAVGGSPKPQINIQKIAEADFTTAENGYMTYSATPPAGTKREDMLNPLIWAHVAKSLRPTDEIRAIPKDGAWRAKYLVMYADRIQAKVEELEFKVLEDVKEEDLENDLYKVKWISPPLRWGVIRKSDKQVVKDSFSMKEDAAKWMQEHLRVMGV